MPSEAHVGTAASAVRGETPQRCVRRNESLGELRSRGQPRAAVPTWFLLQI